MKYLTALFLFLAQSAAAQFNTDRLVTIGRSALYYEDYVVSIQYFNQAINAKPYLYEPWFYRGLAKFYLDDFSGAEQDCSEAIRLNPYVVNSYDLRGMARIRLSKFEAAAADYTKAMTYEPDNKNFRHNRVLCRMQLKDWDTALAELDTMTTRWKTYAPAFSMKAEVYLNKCDTAEAITALEHSSELDPYAPETWSALAAISLSRAKWKEGEEYLDKNLHLQPKNAKSYLNRALARINQNKLRGAMADYDMTLDLEPDNFLGHYNRGLMRANVGDDNRAISDFDFVLKLEPDNTLALFNRALLLDKTGNLRSAIRDYSRVIAQFPNFWFGLEHRAACYRRLGMIKQAEMDEFTVYKARLYKTLYGKQPRLNKDQIRKRSELDVDKYNQLVVEDKEDNTREYSSRYRGKVQNTKVERTLQPMYELTTEPEVSETSSYVAYDAAVDAFNRLGATRKLSVSARAQSLDERQTKRYFAAIDSLTTAISRLEQTGAKPVAGTVSPVDAKRFERAIDYCVTQNPEGAIDDFREILVSAPAPAAATRADSLVQTLIYWQRAVCQTKINAFNTSLGTDMKMTSANVMADLMRAIELCPQSAYLYYNRGCLNADRKDYAAAIDDFTHALAIDPNLPEALYNRGLVYVSTGDKAKAKADLSRAGEAGLYTAYGIIKSLGKQ